MLMNGILSLIFMLSINSLDKNVTYNIANYFIDHLKEVEAKNIREVSKDSFTSTTSLMKFCQLLGFASYNEFKIIFSYTVKDRERQLHEKIKNQTVDELMEKIINLSDMKINLSEFLSNLDCFVDVIHQQKCIYFYGATFPLNLCSSFAEDMTIMGVPVHLVQIPYKIEPLVRKDALHAIVTYSGRFIEQRKLYYLKIIDFAEKTALISREEDIENIDYSIKLPFTKHIDYDDVILLFILDIIKLKYYQKYFMSNTD